MNVERLCGKRAVKGKPGTQGMSNDEIKDFIMKKAPADVKTEFSRLQKKDRSSMCKLLSKFEEGQKLLAASEPPKKANTPPKKTNIELLFNEAMKRASPPKKRSWANIAEGAPMMNENEFAELGNIEEGEEREGGNYENEPFGNLPLQPYVRPSRTKEKDPLRGNVKLSKRQKVMVRRELEKAKKGGKLPELKTAEEQLKFVMLRTPADMAARAKARAPATRFTKPTKVMTFPSTKNGGPTSRIPTKPSVPVISKGARLTKTEVRNIRNRINKLLAGVKINSTVKNQLKNLGYTNDELKNIENGNNYNRIRNQLFKINSEKRRVLKELENSPPARSPPKPSFSMIPGGNKSVAQMLAPLKAKKAGNLTAGERRQMRILQKLRNMELAKRKPKSRMRITNVGNGVEGSNSNSNSASPVRSPLAESMMMAAIGSGNSNTNSNKENSPKARAAKVLAAKPKGPLKRPGIAKVKAASPPKLPVVVTANGKTTLNGVNINSLNKPVLVNAATKIYKKLKPNQTIPFANADVEMLKKLIRKGAKNLAKK